MRAEVGVDTAPRRRPGLALQEPVNPSRLELIRIAPKSVLESYCGPGEGTSWRRGSLGASGPGTRRTCQALPGFPFGSKTPRIIWRLGGGWIRCWPDTGFVRLSGCLSPGRSGQRVWAGLRSCLAPPGFSPSPLAPLQPPRLRHLVESERLFHTRLSPTRPSRVPRWQYVYLETSFLTGWGNGPRARSSLLLGGVL